jgi:predicted RNA-binding Zn-ribbon protein involved in translation (DUF1610 family)
VNAEDRANELYWRSDRSVNQIAEELDLSKGALYELIQPLQTDLGCPLCGVGVVHSNRTAKERGRVDCPACGWDGTEAEAVHGVESGTGRPSEGTATDAEAPQAPRLNGVDPLEEIYPADDFDAPGPPPAGEAGRIADVRRLVAGGALLGAAVGLALVMWARRR